MVYKCSNKDCEDYNKDVEVFRSTTKFVDGVMVDSATKCPKCGSDRNRVWDFKGFTTHIYGYNIGRG